MNAKVGIRIRPPLSYSVTDKAGGLTLSEKIAPGETLEELLVRLSALSPGAFERIFDPARGEIFPPVVTAINGTITSRSNALKRPLSDGDQITWFLVYAGG